MTSIVAHAGYVVADDTAIWGAGKTAGQAWDNMLGDMRAAGIHVIRDAGPRSVEQEAADEAICEAGGSWTRESTFKALSASAELIRTVEVSGGNIAWGSLDGVQCTMAEAENARLAQVEAQ